MVDAWWWLPAALAILISIVLYLGLALRIGQRSEDPLPVLAPVVALGFAVELLVGLLALGRPTEKSEPVIPAVAADLSPLILALQGVGERIEVLGDKLATPPPPVGALGASPTSVSLLVPGVIAFVALFVLWGAVRLLGRRERSRIPAWLEQWSARAAFVSAMVTILAGALEIADRLTGSEEDSTSVVAAHLGSGVTINQQASTGFGPSAVFLLENGVTLHAPGDGAIASFLIPFEEARCRPGPSGQEEVWEGAEPLAAYKGFLTRLGSDLSRCSEGERLARVEVLGFASSSDFDGCPGDSDQLNLELANSRAEAVKKLIEKKSDDRLNVQAPPWGRSSEMIARRRYFDRLTGGHYSEGKGLLNRRVEVRLVEAAGCEKSDKPFRLRTLGGPLSVSGS